MYISSQPSDVKHGETFAKVGNVQLQRFRNSIRLRWRYLSKRYNLTISGLDKMSLRASIAKAQEIDADMTFDRFDTTLAKYDAKRAVQLEPVKIEAKLNLKDIWERYKEANKHRIAETSQKTIHRTVDNALKKVSLDSLLLENSDKLVPALLENYAKSTVQRIGESLTASLLWAYKIELIEKIPYYDFKFKLPKSDRSKKAFTPDEIHRILLAFKTDEFKSKYSSRSHSYYTQFVTCLALTGRRPQDIIALTHEDIIEHHGRNVIKISKAHSEGILKSTKNNLVTLYPINSSLMSCFNRQGVIPNPNNLIFPSHEGKYIDLHNFLAHYWKPIVTKLVEIGYVREYLPLYNLRHSRATQLIRSGIDLASIATLLETSIEMLSKHYLEGDTGIDLPEL